MITRVAVPDDAGAIAEIHVQSWQQAYCGLLPQNFLDSLDPVRRAVRWRESIVNQHPPAIAAVVIADEEALLGVAHVCPARDNEVQERPVGELTSTERPSDHIIAAEQARAGAPDPGAPQ